MTKVNTVFMHMCAVLLYVITFQYYCDYLWQKIIGNYIRVEMSYHAKSLESLTKAYKSLAVLQPDEDMQVGLLFLSTHNILIISHHINSV